MAASSESFHNPNPSHPSDGLTALTDGQTGGTRASLMSLCLPRRHQNVVNKDEEEEEEEERSEALVVLEPSSVCSRICAEHLLRRGPV